MSSESEGKEQKDELLSKKACRRTTGPFGYCCCCCCHSDCALHSLQIRLCKSPDSRISHQKYTCHAVMAPFLIETLISAHFLLFHFSSIAGNRASSSSQFYYLAAVFFLLLSLSFSFCPVLCFVSVGRLQFFSFTFSSPPHHYA